MIRVDTITETYFTCDTPGCPESLLSTWVPLTAALRDAREKGWTTGPIKQLCPTHTGPEQQLEQSEQSVGAQ